MEEYVGGNCKRKRENTRKRGRVSKRKRRRIRQEMRGCKEKEKSK